MRPRERRETGKQDLFRSRLDQIIDMEHALVKVARTIDWCIPNYVQGPDNHRIDPVEIQTWCKAHKTSDRPIDPK
jgi:hypothetical protein